MTREKKEEMNIAGMTKTTDVGMEISVKTSIEIGKGQKRVKKDTYALIPKQLILAGILKIQNAFLVNDARTNIELRRMMKMKTKRTMMILF